MASLIGCVPRAASRRAQFQPNEPLRRESLGSTSTSGAGTGRTSRRTMPPAPCKVGETAKGWLVAFSMLLICLDYVSKSLGSRELLL